MSEQERNDNIEKEEKKSGALREILSMIGWILFIFCLVFLVTTYVGQRTRVEGHSMEPALSDGDNLIVDKISYRFHDPERFDIIIFPYQWEPNTYYIKRIIGLPGETIQIDDEGNIYIDGEVREIQAGDWFRISPEGRRAIRAAADSSIRFICIQTKASSLAHYTMTDGVVLEEKAPWHA